MKEETAFSPLIQWFSDRDRKDLKLNASQVAYIIRHFDPKVECYHMHVKIHSRIFARATLYDPAEYEYKAKCLDCGEWIDTEDVPEVADGDD